MLRVNIYIQEEVDAIISLLANSMNKKKAEVTRVALEQGLILMHPNFASAKAFLDLGIKAEKIPTVGKIPKDFIKNLDYYTWGGKKR